AAALTVLGGAAPWRSVPRLQMGLAGLVRPSLATAAARPAEPATPAAHPARAATAARPHTTRTMIVSLPVPTDSWIVGKALAEIQLENATGVTVLGLERH